MTAAALPAIGEAWPGVEGTFAGVIHTLEGFHALVWLDAVAPRRMSWDDSLQWAASQEGDCPSRIEALTMHKNLPAKLDRGWVWTKEQYSRDGAWDQNFDDGSQDNYGKSYEGLAVAVRRFKLQSFGHFEVAA